MTKQEVIKGMVEFIKTTAESLNLIVEDKGTGHAFDNTFWKDVFKDDSEIPNIVASREDYKIEIRSYWGTPELSIRDSIDKNGEDLIVINYMDVEHTPEFTRTGDYSLHTIELHTDSSHKEKMKDIFEMIDFIERYGKANGE